MIVFLIVIGIIAVLVATIFVFSWYSKKINEKRIVYVKKYSTKYNALLKINERYYFDNSKSTDLVYSYNLKSKRAFDNFKVQDAISNAFYTQRDYIKNAVEIATRNKNLFQLYEMELKSIPQTIFDELPKEKFIKMDNFYKAEEQLIYDTVKVANIQTTLTIEWSYISPAGRNEYYNNRTLNYNDIVKIFFNIYGEDLRMIEENRKRENAIQEVKSKLTKKVYLISQIKQLFKDSNYDASDSFTENFLFSNGFIKKKNTDYYIHSSIKNVKDSILLSSDESGLIVYNNMFKDDEYDNAIDKLQKEGRIIPINNLEFLKVSKELNYQGISLEQIDEFENKLFDYTKKQKYISIETIKNNCQCLVVQTDFEECFIYTIVKYCGFLNEVQGIAGLFTSDKKTQRILFLEWLLSNKKSENAYDLSYNLKECFKVDYPVSSMLYDIEHNNTKLYYNTEMEKVYSSKEYFFEELEGVL